MDSENREVFGGKSFADLLKDIYDNSAKKKKQIEILINELRPLIATVNEAAVIVPLIKDYLEVGVRNDEQLVKMSSVFQKYMAAEDRVDILSKGGGGGGILTAEEKDDLLKEVVEAAIGKENMKSEDGDIQQQLDNLKIKADGLKGSESGSGDK
jgi:hypothetical protein